MTVPSETIERKTGITLWRQIAAALQQDLETGALAPGDRLATEAELAERFQVNRHTVRRAVASLADLGLLRVEQGRGTFVLAGPIDYQLGRRTRFSANLQKQGREPGGRRVGESVLPAPQVVARELGLAEGAPVVLLEHVGEADGVPVAYGMHYFPHARFPDLARIHEQAGGITEALKRCGVSDYTRRTTRLSARLPSEAEAHHLAQPVQRPVLAAEAVNVDPEGRPIQYSLTCFAGDRVQVVVESGAL